MVLTKRAGVVLVDRYRLVSQIGAGAMGTVWRAEDMQQRRLVAVKFMSEEKPDLRARFVREARLSKRLSHPNIVQLLDVGETSDGEPFMVIELLSGQTLEQRLKIERRLPPREAVRIVRDIARAVESAHAAEIMHRDLKPANVFLHDEREAGTEFVVKVLDFGVAKSLGSADQTYATVLGMAVGSPAYMSPEQLLARAVDHRTDLWTLGIILYELIVGTRPFVGTQAEVANQVLIGQTPSICERVRGIPFDIDQVVMKCLERTKDKRIASANELANLLTRILESPEVWRDEPTATVVMNEDADAAKTLLWKPALPPPSASALEVTTQPSPEAPAISPSPGRRQVLTGVMLGAFGGALAVVLLGVGFRWSSKESKTIATTTPSAPSVITTASTKSLEDESILQLAPSAPVTSVPSAAQVPLAKPTGKPVKKVVHVPF